MEKYVAINFETLFDIKGIENKDTSFWLLYKTNKTKATAKMKGHAIYLANSERKFMSVSNVIPETVYYIAYVCGEYYKMESLADQAASKVIDLEQILLKEGFEGKLLKEWEEYNDPIGVLPIPESNIISEMYVHETNGFCVIFPRERVLVAPGIKFRFHSDAGWSKQYGDEPTTEWQRKVLIGYNPNMNLLNKVRLEEIFCIVSANRIREYRQYFADVLLDEQMCLDEESSMELYAFLENNTKKYYIHGNERCTLTRGEIKETKIKDVLFIREEEGKETELYFDTDIMKIRGYETERLFKWWIKGELENTRLKAAMLGVLEH